MRLFLSEIFIYKIGKSFVGCFFGRNTALKPDKRLRIFAEKKLLVAKELFIRKKDASDKHFPCGWRCVFTNCIKLYLVNKKCINTISCGYFFQKSKIVACATYKEARNMIYSVGLDYGASICIVFVGERKRARFSRGIPIKS